MKKKGIELSRVISKEVTEAVLCKICKNLLDDPMECSVCNSGFCRSCIDSWRATYHSCPNNCSNFIIRKAHIIVRNILDQLEVKCENNGFGCEKIIRYENLKKHESECELKPTPCFNSKNGCTKKVLSKNKREHEDKCEYGIFVCKKGCELRILRKDLPNHSCIAELKNIVEKYQSKIMKLSEEAKKTECDLYRAKYKNVFFCCDKCNDEAMEGITYRCTVCNDFDLCGVCYNPSKHPHRMNKIVPIALYTQLTNVNKINFDARKLRVDVTVLVKNYEKIDHVIKFKTPHDSNLTYIDNNHFEVKQDKEVIKKFSFIVAKETFDDIEFYIDRVNCHRYFGMPFTIKLG